MCTFICYFSFIWKHCYLWINTPNSSTFLFELFYISSFTWPHYMPKTSVKSNFMIRIIIKKKKEKKSAWIKLLKNWHSTHVSQISPLTIWEIPPHIICSRVFWWQSWAKMCIVQVFMKSGTPLLLLPGKAPKSINIKEIAKQSISCVAVIIILQKCDLKLPYASSKWLCRVF